MSTSNNKSGTLLYVELFAFNKVKQELLGRLNKVISVDRSWRQVFKEGSIPLGHMQTVEDRWFFMRF